MTTEELIAEIIKVIQIDGDLATDGECLDMVAGLLEEAGYGPIFPPSYRTGDLGSYGRPN